MWCILVGWAEAHSDSSAGSNQRLKWLRMNLVRNLINDRALSMREILHSGWLWNYDRELHYGNWLLDILHLFQMKMVTMHRHRLLLSCALCCIALISSSTTVAHLHCKCMHPFSLQKLAIILNLGVMEDPTQAQLNSILFIYIKLSQPMFYILKHWLYVIINFSKFLPLPTLLKILNFDIRL